MADEMGGLTQEKPLKKWAVAMTPEQKAAMQAKYEAACIKRDQIRKASEAIKLTPISEEAWSQFSGKAKWDCVVALRGPDLVYSANLKWFTSSVIRYALSKVMRVGGLVNTSLPMVILPENDAWGGYQVPKGNFDGGHFLGHILEAAEYLSIPIAKVPAETYNLVYQPGQHYYDLELKFYQVMEAGPTKTTLGKLLALRGNRIDLADALTEKPSAPQEFILEEEGGQNED